MIMSLDTAALLRAGAKWETERRPTDDSKWEARSEPESLSLSVTGRAWITLNS